MCALEQAANADQEIDHIEGKWTKMLKGLKEAGISAEGAIADAKGCPTTPRNAGRSIEIL